MHTPSDEDIGGIPEMGQLGRHLFAVTTSTEFVQRKAIIPPLRILLIQEGGGTESLK
jgi:hypothetical protein